MTSEHPLWWQRNKRPLMIIGITTLVAVTLCAGASVFIYLAYYFRWTWTGFTASIAPHVQQYQLTKTLWDWMQLLFVPFVLAIAAFSLNLATNLNEHRIAQRRKQEEEALALDSQQATLLQNYLDRMSDLLLNHHLHGTGPNNAEARYIARARTLTVLAQLDPERKGSLLRFLYESGLISTGEGCSIIDLSEADLTKANLNRAKLSGANLSGANLSSATLRLASLDDAALRGANLNEADLWKAKLNRIHLNDAKLGRAKLSEADLRGAHLDQTYLWQADLRGAKLGGADLRGAKLGGADLTDANLDGADLRGANLSSATLRLASLDDADLTGAKLDGADLTECKLEEAVYKLEQMKKVKLSKSI